MTYRVCLYCGNKRDKTSEYCPGCGSYRTTDIQGYDIFPYERGEPFIYNGLIVYAFKNLLSNLCEFQFYAGDRLLERIEIERDFMLALREQDSGQSVMPLVWQLFEIAHGDRDLGLIEDNSRRVPALIIYTRIEYPKELLTWENLVEEYRKNPDDVIHFKGKLMYK